MRRMIHITCVVAIVATLGTGKATGDLSWDPGNDGLGGVGNWNTTDLNWDNTPPPDTDANVAWTGGDIAIFETGSGVVTINEGAAIGVNTIKFNSPGGAYTIDAAGAGDSLNLTGSTITADTDATINTKVTAANLSKLGIGALTLNDITGLTGTINATAGTLTLGDPAGLPGGASGVTFGADSTLVNSSGGLMDWTGKTITVNGDFRIGAGDAMKFAEIDPGADYRVIRIDNAVEISHFTGYHSGVVFGGAGTMTLTGEVGGSSFDQVMSITEDLTVVLNSPSVFMYRKNLYLRDSSTLRLDADDQLAPDRIELYDSSTLDINSRTETIELIRLMSPDARIALTTGSLTIATFNNQSAFGGATLDTGTSGILTFSGSGSSFNRSGDSGTVTIAGSGTVSHDGDSLWSVGNSLADIDLRVDAKITGDGTTASGVLSFHSSGSGSSTVLLTNPTNDFNLRLNGARVLLGAAGAQGTGEIEFGSGLLGAATGTNFTLSNDIKLTGSGGFTGEDDLTVTGRINTGASDRSIYSDNTGLVTLAGQIANFDDPAVHTLTFGGSGTVVLTNPANDYTLKVDGATVLLGAIGAGGNGEIQMQSGRLGAATGTNLTISNDIKMTGWGGFAGDGNLTVGGRINTGEAMRMLTLDNTGLVTVSGGMGNFDTADIWTLSFRGAGDLAVATPGNPIHNATIYWDSAGTLTFTGPQQIAGDFSVGNDGSVVLNGGQTVIGNYFVNNGSVTINGTLQVNGVVSIAAGVSTINGGTLISAGRVTVQSTGQAVLNGVQVTAPTVQMDPGASLSGHGTVTGKISTSAGTTITADGGTLTLGDAGQFAAFNHQGELHAGAAAVDLKTKGFASLGPLTTLAGGTLSADNGIVIGPGSSVFGSGNVDAKISSGFGSMIEAAGDLALGNVNSYDGFFSDGSLITGAHTVTINDRNVAVLGSLTELGDGSAQGTLTAGNAAPSDTYSHFLLEQGKNMVGRGYVNGHYKNHGDVIGDGSALAERIVFNAPWIVSGKGTFTRTLVLGTFAPGDSPAVINGTEQAFGGTVQIELGGTTPGSGDDNHDQVNDTATIMLVNSPTLEILPWNSFVPEIGDEFVVMTWQTSLDGEFGDVIVDPWFTTHGIDFNLHYNNVGGAGNLTIEATPEPATLSLLALGGLALVRRRSRRELK